MNNLLTAAVALIVFSCSAQEEIFVPANDPSIRYVGRMSHYGDSVTVYWPASIMEVRFRGTGVSALLSDERGENYFNILLDGQPHGHIKLIAGKKSYQLFKGLEEAEHVITLFKRSEWDQGQSSFFGFEISGELLSPEPAARKIIEVFGNSITAGYAVNDTTGKDSPSGSFTNSFDAYAAMTARYFDADYIATVKSGIGVTISWFDLIMPELFNRLDPTDSASQWDFRSVQPDVVVVNLLQNDSWLINKREHPSFISRFGNLPPDAAKIIEAYASFIKDIRRVYPRATIVCCLGSMDAVKPGSPWPGYVIEAAKSLDDENVLTLMFPYLAVGRHPNVEENEQMAEILISFIEEKLQWKKR